jgi:signal transduction histidine kinase
LSLGLGGLLLLTILGAIVTLTKSIAMAQQLSKVHETHYSVAEALSQLKSDVYLVGILKRDYLLDSGQPQDHIYADQFELIQMSAESSLATIETALGREEAASVARLRSALGAYLQPLRDALDWDRVRGSDLRSHLQRLQVPQRTAALQLASEIEKLNKNALRRKHNEIVEGENHLQRTILVIALAGILLGAIVAASTILHTKRLEKHSDEVQSELRRLSQHVVKVQELERRSISRELHDEVGQMLTGLRMELANLDGPAIQQSKIDSARLQEAKRLTERTLQCVRNISMLLRPSMLDDLGLLPALNWQAKEFSRRSGIPVDVAIDGQVDDVPDDLRTCLYRVVQEALTNVARHARAKRIRLVLKRDAGSVSVAIEDDGDGFPPPRPRARGLGLLGLKERVEELSGTVQIASAPGKGTRISVWIPVTGDLVC